MTGDSFSFGRYNSMDDWGIMVLNYDVLLPPKRSRKLTIPGRSGAFDFGAKNWEERPLRIQCMLTRKSVSFRILTAKSVDKSASLFSATIITLFALYNEILAHARMKSSLRSDEIKSIHPASSRISSPQGISSSKMISPTRKGGFR